MKLLLAFLVAFVVVVKAHEVIMPDNDRCTTIIVGPGAGVDGVMTTHTADCADCDFRMNKVPRRKHKAGAMRKLYMYKNDYPAKICDDRGETWKPENLEGSKEQKASWGTESDYTGSIPEVEETYALIEAGYGIMNEHQVAIGESTCASKLYAFPSTHGGKARIEVSQMSEIALERTKTAADAVKLMGKLAEELGFYAADWTGGDASKGEGGEALTVIDPNEAWVFHVCADDTGTSAVWVAQRVPEGHIAAVANSFVIREIKEGSPDFMYSSNIFDVAKRNGFWDGKGDLDFLPTYAPMRTHSIYSTRRVWRVFDLAAPSLKLPGDTDAFANDYPFSVPVDRKLTVEDIMGMNRDHYEGTPYDMTKGTPGGPYGDPARFDVTPTDGMSMTQALDGSYERSISIFRTSYSFVAVARKSIVSNLLAMIWFGQYQPSTSNYVPVYVHADAAEPLTRGSLFQFDSDIPFWNYLVVNNYASRFYLHAIDDIKALQKGLQDMSFKAVKEFEEKATKMIKAGMAGEYYAEKYGGVAPSTELPSSVVSPVLDAMNGLCIWQIEAVSGAWRDFFPKLVTTLHDGYYATDLKAPKINMNKLFYPKWWLDVSGYFLSRPNPMGPDTILFGPSPISRTEGGGLILFLFICGLVGMSGYIGFKLGTKSDKIRERVDGVSGGLFQDGATDMEGTPARGMAMKTRSAASSSQGAASSGPASASGSRGASSLQFTSLGGFARGTAAHRYEQI